MQYRFTLERHQEVDTELASMQAYLEALAQEIRDKTAPGKRYNYMWSQADNSAAYVRSLRTALQAEQEAYNPLYGSGTGW
jgi:hypothetical protein